MFIWVFLGNQASASLMGSFDSVLHCSVWTTADHPLCGLSHTILRINVLRYPANVGGSQPHLWKKLLRWSTSWTSSRVLSRGCLTNWNMWYLGFDDIILGHSKTFQTIPNKNPTSCCVTLNVSNLEGSISSQLFPSTSTLHRPLAIDISISWSQAINFHWRTYPLQRHYQIHALLSQRYILVLAFY